MSNGLLCSFDSAVFFGEAVVVVGLIPECP